MSLGMSVCLPAWCRHWDVGITKCAPRYLQGFPPRSVLVHGVGNVYYESTTLFTILILSYKIFFSHKNAFDTTETFHPQLPLPIPSPVCLFYIVFLFDECVAVFLWCWSLSALTCKMFDCYMLFKSIIVDLKIFFFYFFFFQPGSCALSFSFPVADFHKSFK